MQTQAPITILMADDDPDDRLMARDAFAECALPNPLRFAEDGEELMAYLHRLGRYADQGAYPTPGLILLDLNMPRKNGLEALNEIKNSPDLKGIPVILLTTSGAERDIASSYELGANSYITKPLNFDDFLNVVKQLGVYWLELVSLPRVH